jgi:hypothetical protein
MAAFLPNLEFDAKTSSIQPMIGYRNNKTMHMSASKLN